MSAKTATGMSTLIALYTFGRASRRLSKTVLLAMKS